MADTMALDVAVPVVRNLIVGIPVMLACIVLQAFIVVSLTRYQKRRAAAATGGSFLGSVGTVSIVMLMLIVGNMAQVALWGLLFRLLGEFDHFGEAVYHSAVNFATLGYGDIVMSSHHKLLGPLEAINGALMIGVSTAVLLAAFQISFAQAVARDRD